MNNVKLLEYEVGSPDWEAKVKASKFAAYPNYGRARRGYIGIQGDHSGMLMLRHLGEVDAGNRLEKAVADVIKEGKNVTYDLKADRNDPTAVGTREMAQAICAKLK